MWKCTVQLVDGNLDFENWGGVRRSLSIFIGDHEGRVFVEKWSCTLLIRMLGLVV